MGAAILVPGALLSSRPELVGLLPASLHSEVRRLAARFGVASDLSEAPALVSSRIEGRCPDIVLVDTDLLGCPDALCRLARSLRQDVRVVALACFWSDREESLRACVDAVIHKPLREDEWTSLFGRLVSGTASSGWSSARPVRLPEARDDMATHSMRGSHRAADAA